MRSFSIRSNAEHGEGERARTVHEDGVRDIPVIPQCAASILSRREGDEVPRGGDDG